MSEKKIESAQALFDSIINERGGLSAFSGVQERIVHALTRALVNPADIDPVLVAKLTELLPPVTARSSGPGRLDIASCPDHVVARVDEMCAEMAGYCAQYGRTPDADGPEALLRETLDMNAKLQELVDREQARCRVLEDRLVVVERLARENGAAADKERAAREHAEADAWRARHAADERTRHGQPDGQGAASGKRSNIVDIGNGYAGVSGTLAERYPSLAFDDPVAK